MTEKNNIKLEEISKETPFKVPEHYFENFSARLTDKISQTEAFKEPKLLPSWIQPRRVAILAFAGIAMVFAIGIIFFNQRNKPLSGQEMVEAYKYSAIQEITDEQLAQILAGRQKGLHSISDTTNQYKEKEAIIDYLSKENIDINTIIDAQ